MFISPISNTAVLKQEWTQVKPVVTQHFGENPQVYAQFNMKGHNGTDLRAKTGTPLFAPMDGIIKTKDSLSKGYGKHIFIRNPFKACEVVLAHLDKFNVTDGQRVSVGDLIGWSGNSGFSTASHLHWSFRLLKPGDWNKIYDWGVLDSNNGYFGWLDPLDFTLAWKGSLLKNNL